MSAIRPPRRLSFRPAVAGALLLFCLLSSRANSSDRLAMFRAPGLLSGGAQTGRGQAVQRPYFLAWSVESSPRKGLIATYLEPGGVTVDPRSGWVYVTTREGRVLCLEDGRERWAVEAGGEFLAPPTVFEESVIAGNDEGVLFVFNKVTGELRTRAVLNEELITRPLAVRLDDGPPIAYVGSSAEALFAVNLEYGERLWRAYRDPPGGFTIRGFSRPALGDGVLYLGFADGTLEARDPISGLVQWERRISPPGEMVDVDAVVYDAASDTLYATSYSGGVFALDPASGATRWRTPLPGAVRLNASGPLIFAVSPGQVTALRPADGDIAWRFRLDKMRIGTEPVLAAGLVLVAQEEGPLYFLDALSGSPEGVFATGSGFSSAPAGLGAVLHALSNGGRVYSMGLVP